MSSLRAVKHPETRDPYAEGTWPLYQTAAELDLLTKANSKFDRPLGPPHDKTPLTEEEKAQLLIFFGPIFGKALADPSSLTSQERHVVQGWPDEETLRANLEAVGLGSMTADQVMAKACQDTEWMTLEQANLVRQHFNTCPLDAPNWRPDGRAKASSLGLVRTEEEASAYRKAFARWRELSGFSIQEIMSRDREREVAVREARRRDFENRKAKGQLTDRELYLVRMEEKSLKEEEVRRLAREKQQAECDATFGKTRFGFCMYRTSELQDLLDEYLALAEDKAKGLFRGKRYKVFGRAISKTNSGEGNEFDVMHKALTGDDDRHPVHDLMKGKIQDLIAPDSAASLFRHDHRTRREDNCSEGLHPRYFLVMDREGFPPLDNIIFHNKVVLPEVWVYDVDWDPPSDGDGVRDTDGYEGRLKVRFSYNVHMHFYPLTRQEGFDMKKLWTEQVDHNKPYPFPGHDVTYENVRERVPWTGSEIPDDVWGQFM